MTNTALEWTIIALVAVAAGIVIAAVISSRRRARIRSLELQRRFGPEYDRAVQELGTPASAERELSSRTRRAEHLPFHELNAVHRARFGAAWSRIQSQFVDDPPVAVQGANELIKEIMRVRGYPAEDFQHRVADLSVEYPMVIQHYRAARALSEPNRDGQVNTEELRQAVVHYRVLFAELLQEPSSSQRPLHEVHA